MRSKSALGKILATDDMQDGRRAGRNQALFLQNVGLKNIDTFVVPFLAVYLSITQIGNFLRPLKSLDPATSKIRRRRKYLLIFNVDNVHLPDWILFFE